MNVPLLDLKAQYDSIRADVEPAIRGVMESQHYILGPSVELCEDLIARYASCSYAVGVSSGSDALLVCLMAEAVGVGDEVITTPYTFFATAGCIARLSAKPVFVDIDPATYNLSVPQIAEKVTARTKALIPVHLFGQSADMQPLMEVARRRHLIVVEDAAQAIGAEYRGRRVGSIGDYGCFSFFPSKNLGAAGDGGMVVTNSPDKLERLQVLRGHGSKPKYHHRMIGGNFRLDALQAAIVTAKLQHLDDWTERRNANARRYDRLFADSGLETLTTVEWARQRTPGQSMAAGPQLVRPSAMEQRHVFNQYVIRVASRDRLKAHLQSCGVNTEVYYPVPMHLQECFEYLGHRRGDFPESELAADETLALPIYPELSDEQASYVVESIRGFFARAD